MIPTGLPPQFLNWFKTSDGTKLPCNAMGMTVDAHDPRHWMTYEQAASTGRGVAFVLTDAIGWFFLDMDKCGPDWTPAATDLFMRFAGCWGEVSSSGTGLHIMGRCNPARLADRKRRWDGWLECYTGARFIAFGGGGWNRIGGVDIDYDWTDVLLSIVPQKQDLGPLPEGVDPTYTGPADDAILLARAMQSGSAAAKFGMKATFRALWEADNAILSVAYPGSTPGTFDHSAADQSLLTHLAFWTGKDMPRMDRLFRMSKLCRPKYLEREDYRRETIGNAARLCTKVYDEPRPAESTSIEQYLTLPEMQKHFEGCVYIRDSHRVLVPGGALLKPEQFNAVYGGHQFQMQADGTKPSTKAFEAFTENRAVRFPKVERTVFNPAAAPGQIIGNAVNMYYPADVEMKQGDVTPFLDLMQKLLPDARDREILTSYMAACVQHIGSKFQWAPVLQGVEGNGKTALFSTVAYAVGQKFVHSPKPEQLANQFNGYIEGKLFILVEEVHMRDRVELLDILKPLITNLQVETENKGANKQMTDNRANWAFCTNFRDAIIKSRNDRRYAMFFTAQQHVDDLARDGMTGDYFPRLYDWLRNGGYAAVAWWLKHYPIRDDLNPAKGCHRAPETSSTSAAIKVSTGNVERDIQEACEDGTYGFRGGWISTWALTKLARDNNLRISRHKLRDIIETMGYVEWGRALRPLDREEGKRPVLYRLSGHQGTFEDYVRAQLQN